MLRVGLSGGIGSGKSTVAGRFAELGALVVDSDLLAREVVSAGSDGLAAIVDRFGASVLAGDGSLDRSALGGLVFADSDARRDLERITHPRIAARAAEVVAAASPEQVVVHDVPLLVEKQMGASYHLVVIVAADEATRMARLTGARGLTRADARSRIAAQASDADRRAAADVWLDNSARVDVTLGQVDALWADRLEPFNRNLLTARCAPRPEPRAAVPYDESWPGQAARLMERVLRALGGIAASVEHVGPTSVPGLAAEDLIELQVGVRQLENADEPKVAGALAAQGFPRAQATPQDRLHGAADPGQPPWSTCARSAAPGGARLC